MNAPQPQPQAGVLGASSSQYGPFLTAGPTRPQTAPRLSSPGAPAPQAGFDPFAGAQQAAQSQYDIDLANENTAFDYNAAQLQNQLGALGGQKETQLGEIETGLGNIRNEVGSSRTKSQSNTERQIGDAGAVAKSTQDKNRQVLRALGILNSSAAGDLLSKPMNEFGKQRAQLQEALGQRFSELDNFLNQKVSEAEQVKRGIVEKYNGLVQQIQTDLRFNERQRLDAVRSANQALSQRLQDIQNATLDYQNQVNAQKQQFVQGIQQMSSYQDPTADLGALQGLALTSPQAQSQQLGIYQPSLDLNKKKLGRLSDFFG